MDLDAKWCQGNLNHLLEYVGALGANIVPIGYHIFDLQTLQDFLKMRGPSW